MYEKEPERAREALDEDDDDPHGEVGKCPVFRQAVPSNLGRFHHMHLLEVEAAYVRERKRLGG